MRILEMERYSLAIFRDCVRRQRCPSRLCGSRSALVYNLLHLFHHIQTLLFAIYESSSWHFILVSQLMIKNAATRYPLVSHKRSGIVSQRYPTNHAPYLITSLRICTTSAGRCSSTCWTPIRSPEATGGSLPDTSKWPMTSSSTSLRGTGARHTSFWTGWPGRNRKWRAESSRRSHRIIFDWMWSGRWTSLVIEDCIGFAHLEQDQLEFALVLILYCSLQTSGQWVLEVFSEFVNVKQNRFDLVRILFCIGIRIGSLCDEKPVWSSSDTECFGGFHHYATKSI